MSNKFVPKSQRVFPFLPNDKDSYELECVCRVLQTLPEYVTATAIKHESPDVLVKLESSTIGVEVCDFVRGQAENGSPLRRKESVKQQTADYARHWFEVDNHFPIYVQILWRENSDPTQNQAEIIGIAIAQAVSSAIPEGEYSHNEIVYSDALSSLISQQLASIYILRLPITAYSSWSSVQWSPTGENYLELQSIINKKNAKYSSYRKECSEVWLVISVMGISPVTTESFDSKDLDHCYNTPFERVFIYLWYGNSVKQLKRSLISN